MTQKEIAKLQRMAKALDNPVAIIQYIDELETKIEELLPKVDAKLENLLQDVKKMYPDINGILEQVKGKDGVDGKSIKGEKGDKGERGEKGEKGNDGRDGRDGKDGVGRDGRDGLDGQNPDPQLVVDLVEKDIPKLGERIRDSLELLKDDNRLDVSAIKGLSKRETTLTDSIINRAIGIVDQRTSFLINKVSALKTQVDNLNLTSTGGGGWETPAGLVNGVNTSFTVANEPVMVFTEQGGMIDGAGYSYAGGTITLLIAPQLFIRSSF